MKQKIDFTLLRALFRKQRQERLSAFKKNFDFVGFVMRIVLYGALIAVLSVFLARFADMYLDVMVNYEINPAERAYEVLTLCYSAVLALMVLSAVAQINRELFFGDDVRILSALPVNAKTLYVSKLASIYLGQAAFSAVTVTPISIALGSVLPQGAWFWCMTAVAVFTLPLVSLGIASLLALPSYYLRLILRRRYVLNFVVVTLITAALIAVYWALLEGIKQLLLGDDLKYFFNEKVMSGIAATVHALFPANCIASFVLGRYALSSAGWVALLLAICTAVGLVFTRLLLVRSMQQGIGGVPRYRGRRRPFGKAKKPFAALVKKEFLAIFRTPNYTFSYFSMALVQPLMVYLCMSVGSSLVVQLLGIACNWEIAVFLTLLFGCLANMFCTTNVSRDGAMFFSVKAMPLSGKAVMYSKVALCMVVTAASQLFSALLLGVTGSLAWYYAAYLFALGTAFGFAQVCLATAIDFRRPHFAVAKGNAEEGNTVSTVALLGIAIAFVVGICLLVLRMAISLRNLKNLEFLSYVVCAVAAVAAATVGAVCLTHRLEDKYYNFEGGAH